MLPEHRVEDEPCPVTDQMLGEIYRASAHGLNELIATVPPTARALLAVFCYRRAHLASIGLAIAATCEEDDLTSLGGNAGAMLFERSRKAPRASSVEAHISGRRKVTLAAKSLCPPAPFEDRRRLPSWLDPLLASRICRNLTARSSTVNGLGRKATPGRARRCGRPRCACSRWCRAPSDAGARCRSVRPAGARSCRAITTSVNSTSTRPSAVEDPQRLLAASRPRAPYSRVPAALRSSSAAHALRPRRPARFPRATAVARA